MHHECSMRNGRQPVDAGVPLVRENVRADHRDEKNAGTHTHTHSHPHKVIQGDPSAPVLPALLIYSIVWLPASSPSLRLRA